MHFWGGGWERWQEAAIILPGRGEVESKPAAGSQGGKLLLCHFRTGNLQSGETFFLFFQLEAFGNVVMFLETKQINLS